MYLGLVNTHSINARSADSRTNGIRWYNDCSITARLNAGKNTNSCRLLYGVKKWSAIVANNYDGLYMGDYFNDRASLLAGNFLVDVGEINDKIS